ncbi:PRC-barrel domain containing protein [Halomicrobium salinisoli]|uniref:PRC-barrel domain containing protein n=1 Tax=Halomicrobium salinisoli TaxID=2878391 RepID=UPI001CF0641F|nr:PRC-barrel domain containing protein [Halomicrobium salinisoli]
MTADLTDDDRGKAVVTNNKRVGVVTDVQGGRAFVDPEWDNVDDDLADTLDWDRDDDDYRLDSSAITDARNDQLYLRDDL